MSRDSKISDSCCTIFISLFLVFVTKVGDMMNNNRGKLQLLICCSNTCKFEVNNIKYGIRQTR